MEFVRASAIQKRDTHRAIDGFEREGVRRGEMDPEVFRFAAGMDQFLDKGFAQDLMVRSRILSDQPEFVVATSQQAVRQDGAHESWMRREDGDLRPSRAGMVRDEDRDVVGNDLEARAFGLEVGSIAVDDQGSWSIEPERIGLVFGEVKDTRKPLMLLLAFEQLTLQRIRKRPTAVGLEMSQNEEWRTISHG
jgi:hypothetical protein